MSSNIKYFPYNTVKPGKEVNDFPLNKKYKPNLLVYNSGDESEPHYTPITIGGKNVVLLLDEILAVSDIFDSDSLTAIIESHSLQLNQFKFLKAVLGELVILKNFNRRNLPSLPYFLLQYGIDTRLEILLKMFSSFTTKDFYKMFNKDMVDADILFECIDKTKIDVLVKYLSTTFSPDAFKIFSMTNNGEECYIITNHFQEDKKFFGIFLPNLSTFNMCINNKNYILNTLTYKEDGDDYIFSNDANNISFEIKKDKCVFI